MNLLLKKGAIYFVLLTMFLPSVYTQICPDNTSGYFLLLNPDAQASSMGNTGITNSTLANSIYSNVSLSLFHEKKSASSISYAPTAFLDNGNMISIAGMSKIGQKQSFGFSAKYIDYSEVNFTDINGNPTGTGQPYEYELSAAYGRLIFKNLSVGIRAKIIISNLATDQFINGIAIQNGTSLAADLSVSYKKTLNEIGDQFLVGVSLSNQGQNISYTQNTIDYRLPRNFGIGISYYKYVNEDLTIILAAEYNNIIHKNLFISEVVLDQRTSFGTQLKFKEKYKANVGYQIERNKTEINGLFESDLFSIGLGLSHQNLNFDVAYQRYITQNLSTPLSGVQSIFLTDEQNLPIGEGLRFTLSYNFD